MKQIIGYIMIGVFFIHIFVFVVVTEGFTKACIMFSFAIFASAFLTAGIFLATK